MGKRQSNDLCRFGGFRNNNSLALRALKTLLDEPDEDLAAVVAEGRRLVIDHLKTVRARGALVPLDPNDLHHAAVLLNSHRLMEVASVRRRG